MKSIFSNRLLKLFVYLLGSLAIIATVFASIFVFFLASHGAYNRTPINNDVLFFNSGLCREVSNGQARQWVDAYYGANVFIPAQKAAGETVDQGWEGMINNRFEDFRLNPKKMFSVTIQDRGEIVYTNKLDLPVLHSLTVDMRPDYESLFYSSAGNKPDYSEQEIERIYSKTYSVQIDIYQIYDRTDDVQVFQYAFVSTINQNRTLLFLLPFAAGILFLLCMGFLIKGAGRRKEVAEIRLTWYDKLPLDLSMLAHLLITLFVIYGSTSYIYRIFIGFVMEINYLEITLAGLALWVASVLIMLFIVSFAARVKAGKWWRNSLVWRFLRLLGNFYRNLPLLWKGLLVMIGFLVLDPLLLLSSQRLWLVWIFIRLVIIIIFCLLMIQLDRLKKAGDQLAAGKLDHIVDEAGLVADLRSHAKNLNSIRQGVGRAVEERLKSERFKTELITNVSHDIRTPLTSIINYVDLLKRQPHEDQTTREYIDVIDRQAGRLKKLTEDIIDASKAATGNIEVKPRETNLNEMIAQISEEYAERFATAELTLVSKAPEEHSVVVTDSKLLWRILDNLFQNTCKYALPGTRVYLDLNEKPDGVDILLRNVSREVLNMDGEILLERFVQGDPSRSSEGSGLGLSIAQNLAGLIGGNLDLMIDGDLFKVTLHLPKGQLNQ